MTALSLTTVNTIANVSILTVLIKLQLFSLAYNILFPVSQGFFILGLQPRDQAAMLDGNTIECFLEEFTWK